MTPEHRPSPDAGPPGSGSDDPWQGDGFGLALSGAYAVIGLTRRKAGAAPEATRLLLEDQTAVTALPEGRHLRALHYADGRLGMVIDDHGDQGLAILAEEFGTHLISRDGRTIRSRPAAGLPAWRWQRLLTGQALPLAAALRGLEVLHASALAVGDMAFALAGDSGAGKSSLAARLVLRGHRLLTDDVLAVSLDASGRPQAHPGSTALSLRRDESELVEQLVTTAGASAIGSDDKEHVLCSATDARMPLAAVYYLRRRDAGAQPIGEPRSPAFTDLMSCSYVKYVGTQSRRTAQLSLHAAIARNCLFVPVNVGSAFTPERLAAELDAHMSAVASQHNQS